MVKSVTNIVITGCYKIGINANNRIKVNDLMLSIEDEIPFIRYRFETYGDQEYNYIRDMQSKFKNSVHLVEIKLDENTEQILSNFETNFQKIAKYIYADITDTEVNQATLNQTTTELLAKISNHNIDRIMFKDKSTSLNVVSFKKMITPLIKSTGIKEDHFGICSSPLSFGDYACLTAVKARELMSIYKDEYDLTLPTANHQCMNCCGCIKYTIVENDLPAPAETKQPGVKKATNSKENNSEDKHQKPKTKPKMKVKVGQFSL